MNAELLSVLLDVVVLVFLGITIYYALKLSKSLNNFRAYRKEFDGIMAELNTNIEQAYDAVKSLKDTGNRSADDLEYLLRESQKVGEDLKAINKTSNALAERLEGLSQLRTQAVDASNSAGAEGDDYDEQLYKNVERFERSDPSGAFSIQDREFSQGDDTSEPSSAAVDTGDFKSQAEKDLYDALKGKGKGKTVKKGRAR